MNQRLVILLSLLVLSVAVAGVSLWVISKWRATPVAHPVWKPPRPEVTKPMPVEVPNQIQVGEPAPMGKINIGEVCQGALAYMTFTDGAAAEAFVEDCKAGKHPEVIEQYKANLNLGTGAAI